MSFEPQAIKTCSGCGTQLAPTMLACPRCSRLTHSDELDGLARTAREATERGDLSAALAAWREALTLLPANSKQHEIISAKITDLGERLPPGLVVPEPTAGQQPSWGTATGLGAIGLALWKLKTLLLGLTKASTLLTMLLSLGVYWTAWGWKFALGIVLSIYVHEMGHVIALRRLGFKASAPMFIPGIGAVVRLQQRIVNPREDAEIGLAGPIYGLGAAVVSLVLWLVTAEPIFAAIAGVGAWINLFNLLPLGPLDGGRGFHAMSAQQRWICAATALIAWMRIEDGMLMLVAIVGVLRAITTDRSAPQQSWRATLTYCLLIALLSAIVTVRSQIQLPG